MTYFAHCWRFSTPNGMGEIHPCPQAACTICHRRRSSVNFEGKDILSENICIKNKQNARILHDRLFARKVNNMSDFCMIFALIIVRILAYTVAPKIFFAIFMRRGACAPSPRLLSYTPIQSAAKQTVLLARPAAAKSLIVS